MRYGPLSANTSIKTTRYLKITLRILLRKTGPSDLKNVVSPAFPKRMGIRILLQDPSSRQAVYID